MGMNFSHDIAPPPEIVSTLFGIAQRPFSSLFCTSHTSSAFSHRSNTVSGKGLSWHHWDVYSWVWCHPTRDMSAMVPKVICCQHTTILLASTPTSGLSKIRQEHPSLFRRLNHSSRATYQCWQPYTAPFPKQHNSSFLEFLGRIFFSGHTFDILYKMCLHYLVNLADSFSTLKLSVLLSLVFLKELSCFGRRPNSQ